MRLKIFILNLFIFCGLALDRLTKLYFHKTDNYLELIPGQLLFNLHYNQGLIFGWGKANLVTNGVILLIILILGGWLAKAYRQKNWRQITAWSLILIGALSNLMDRLYLGAVIDWLRIPWWSVFNLADVYIVLGTLILSFALLYESKEIPEE